MRKHYLLLVTIWAALCCQSLWAEKWSVGTTDPLRLGGNRIFIEQLHEAGNPLWDIRMNGRQATGLLFGADIYDPDNNTVGPANFVAQMPSWGKQCDLIKFTIRAKIKGIWYETEKDMQLVFPGDTCNGGQPPPPPPPPAETIEVNFSDTKMEIDKELLARALEAGDVTRSKVYVGGVGYVWIYSSLLSSDQFLEKYQEDPPPPPDPEPRKIDIDAALEALLRRVNAWEFYEDLLKERP